MPPDLAFLVTLAELGSVHVPIGTPLFYVPGLETPGLPRPVIGHAESGPLVHHPLTPHGVIDPAAWAISLQAPAENEAGEPMWLDMLPWAAERLLAMRGVPWLELPSSSRIVVAMMQRNGTFNVQRSGRIARYQPSTKAPSHIPAHDLDLRLRFAVAQVLRDGVLRGGR